MQKSLLAGKGCGSLCSIKPRDVGKNQQRIGDFRTDGNRNPVDFTNLIPDCVAQAAILATHTQGTDFAGVDVLEATDGKPYVLEANYPCYYYQKC